MKAIDLSLVTEETLSFLEVADDSKEWFLNHLEEMPVEELVNVIDSMENTNNRIGFHLEHIIYLFGKDKTFPKTFNRFGQIIYEKDLDNNGDIVDVSYEYSHTGKLIEKTTSNITYQYMYDEDRLSCIGSDDGAIETFTYQDGLLKELVKTFPDKLNKGTEITRLTHDSLGRKMEEINYIEDTTTDKRIIQQREVWVYTDTDDLPVIYRKTVGNFKPDKSALICSWEYDQFGNIIKYDDTSGTRYGQLVNEKGAVIKRTYPNGDYREWEVKDGKRILKEEVFGDTVTIHKKRKDTYTVYENDNVIFVYTYKNNTQ